MRASLPNSFSRLVNWEGIKINPYRKAYFTILATHVVMLRFFDYGLLKLGQTIYFMLIIQVAVNTILHSSFCRKGAVAPFALSPMWLSCILPLYIYCFHFASDFRTTFQRAGLFAFLGFCALLPVVALSALTATAYCLTRMIEKKRKE